MKLFGTINLVLLSCFLAPKVHADLISPHKGTRQTTHLKPTHSVRKPHTRIVHSKPLFNYKDPHPPAIVTFTESDLRRRRENPAPKSVQSAAANHRTPTSLDFDIAGANSN